MNHFGGGTSGRNLFLAGLMLWAGIRAVEVTFILPRLVRAAAGGKQPTS